MIEVSVIEVGERVKVNKELRERPDFGVGSAGIVVAVLTTNSFSEREGIYVSFDESEDIVRCFPDELNYEHGGIPA